MTLVDEVNQLRQQGTADEVITQLLTRRGYPAPEVANALATSAIKDAVNPPGDQDLQPSLTSTTYTQDPAPLAIPQQEPAQQYQYADQIQYQDGGQGYGAGVSGDTIAEIAEQVVTEKLARTENALTQLALFKGTSEAQLRSLDERLKRIENIIDKLQLSLLQRVGDYLTNVDDLKRELIETQKTVKTIGNRHTPSSSSRAKPTAESE